MSKNNRNLLIIGIIALVNALGYGIIIPILPKYSESFGLSYFQNGLLFSIFSFCTFLATPIIGRLSDKYGRRPLLIASIAGTAISFFMMAFAQNAAMLFIARALDGITAGNIPVASAVISDTTDEKNRAKGFGIIGASFGFGFVFGPAISAFTVGTSLSLPFIIAGCISILAVLATTFFLPETNKHMGEIQQNKLFDFKKLFGSIKDPQIGRTLLITLLYFTAFGMLILSFNQFATDVLRLSLDKVAMIFTVFGLVGLITQALIIGPLTKRFGIKSPYTVMLALAAIGFLGIFFTRSVPLFILVNLLLGFANSSVQPLTQTLLSMESDAKSQGSIQGLNASYQSIGTTIGPIVGGFFASLLGGIQYPFLFGSVLIAICFYLSLQISKLHLRKKTAF